MCYILISFMPVISSAQFSDSTYSVTTEVNIDSLNSETQEYYEDSDTYVIPTSPVLHSKFISADTVAKWRNSRDFEKLKNLDSLLKKIQAAENKELKQEEKAVSWLSKFLQSSLFKNILWIIAGIVVLFILYQLILSKGLFVNKKVRKNIQEQQNEELDEVQWGSLASLLQAAIDKKNYRAATRYLFLDTLKLLGDKGLVHIQHDKTNSQYRQEMPQYLRNNFSRLALYYEYIWYGNTPLQADQFNELQSRFSQFKSSVRS